MVLLSHTLHIITGPTAVGKTEYALRYAEAHGAEIVSCDALLVYRGMDIGTAKPTLEEQARARHHLIDVCAVDEAFDIVAYDRLARAAVADIISRGKAVVVAGGSGFYLKSFLAPVIDTVETPDALRREVTALYESEGLEGLLAGLRELNPAGIENLDTQNPRRVRRALERCRASGKPLGELQAEFAARPEPYGEFSKRLVLLERDRDDLRERVAQRAAGMLRDGLVDEVRALCRQGIEGNPSAASAIGYRETLACLRGEMPEAELLPVIVQNTMRLVKKQRAWLRAWFCEPDERVRL